MNRFIYWLKVRFCGKESHCNHFCVTCKYFARCEEDLSLLFIGKRENITEVRSNVTADEGDIHADLRKAS